MSTQIGFSTSNAAISAAIRSVTGSKVSHCFLLYDDLDFKRQMVMHAVGGGFTLVSYSQFRKHNKIVKLISPMPSIDPGMADLAEWLDQPYDFSGAAGIAAISFARVFGEIINNPFDQRSAMFCSEAVVLLLKAVKYPGADKLVAANTSPEDILKFLSQP